MCLKFAIKKTTGGYVVEIYIYFVKYGRGVQIFKKLNKSHFVTICLPELGYFFHGLSDNVKLSKMRWKTR